MNKATHQGHCQLCGRLQKLPDGKLAKHGYTKEFHYFQGTCNGSGFLPYEQSCALLPAQRDFAATAAKQLYAQAKKERELRDPNAVWVNEYVRGALGRMGYQWRQVAMTLDEYGTARYTNWENRSERFEAYGVYERDRVKYLEAVIAYANERKAHGTTENAKHFANYVKWAQRRIDAWKLADLQPIKEVA